MAEKNHDLAAALLRDVPRHTAQDAANMTTHGASVWLHEDAVLAALSSGLDPAIAERAGKVLENVTPGPWKAYYSKWEPINFIVQTDHPCRRVLAQFDGDGDGPDAQSIADARFIAWARNNVPALLAQIAALRAERDEAEAEARKLRRAISYILDGMGIDGPNYAIDPDDDFLDAANSEWVRDTLTRLAAALTTEADNAHQA